MAGTKARKAANAKIASSSSSLLLLFDLLLHSELVTMDATLVREPTPNIPVTGI